MPQSPYLNEFIEDMIRTLGRTREDIVRELCEAARGAVVAHFGDATPVEVELDRGDNVCVYQVLDVVETVTDRSRQIALLAATRLDPKVVAGKPLRVPIRY